MQRGGFPLTPQRVKALGIALSALMPNVHRAATDELLS